MTKPGSNNLNPKLGWRCEKKRRRFRDLTPSPDTSAGKGMRVIKWIEKGEKGERNERGISIETTYHEIMVSVSRRST